MSNILSITNHKGGVAKTTSAINIGAGLSMLGQSVLLIDLDPQANLSISLGIEEPETNIYGAMKNHYDPQPINIIDKLDIIPSILDLSGAEIELSSETGREYILKELIEPLKNNYDFTIIDCPPSLGLLTINALTTSDEIIIPLQAHYLALRGLTKLLEIVSKVQKRLNNSLKIGGIIITQYSSRKVLNRDIGTSIEKHFPNKVFKTKIRENIALAEAPSSGLDIFRYNYKSNGAEDYMNLSKEIFNKYK